MMMMIMLLENKNDFIESIFMEPRRSHTCHHIHFNENPVIGTSSRLLMNGLSIIYTRRIVGKTYFIELETEELYNPFMSSLSLNSIICRYNFMRLSVLTFGIKYFLPLARP